MNAWDACWEGKGKQKFERASEDRKESVAEKYRVFGAREGGGAGREQGEVMLSPEGVGHVCVPSHPEAPLQALEGGFPGGLVAVR